MIRLVPVLDGRKRKKTKTDMAHSVLRFLRRPFRIDCDQTIDSKRDSQRSASRMRQARQKQLNLTPEWLPLEHARELQAIDRVLKQNPAVAELIWRDLSGGRVVKNEGAEGMSAVSGV